MEQRALKMSFIFIIPNYERRATMSKEDEVRQASDQFYAGLTRMIEGDLSVLEGIWSHDETVTAMHPVDGREVGWEAVRESFVPFTELASNGSVELHDQIIRVLGDVAYEVGIESGHFTLAGKPITVGQRVTNIYRYGDGGWKMIHHHTDVSQSMVDAVRPLPQGKHKVQQSP
jgi:ketosteroid isomerase-like protein